MLLCETPKNVSVWPLMCHVGAVMELLVCLFAFHEVGDVRVRFSFAGLSGETSDLGPAQTVSAADNKSSSFFMFTFLLFIVAPADSLNLIIPLIGSFYLVHAIFRRPLTMLMVLSGQCRGHAERRAADAL